ncbi:nuclear transport factor 2 family protein [Mycobacterium decipiens]|uniref:DUF4440 domain-containing protein n=1 Tax=Mycobacterium decipiens TaxID=1430326 RepID=A0A1X2LT17_9MYCO|nr:nuclear transport factor 2 family protein [Mycobacterium decipiens]OSC39953.1 DUF4440 domain-containing protein [Mycobacterium decipiens]
MVEAATTLCEIEAIKQLKARYCPTPGHQAVGRLLFTDGFVSDTSQSGGKLIRGADEFVSYVRNALGTQPTVHQVHALEIALTSATTAIGVWALEDVVRVAPAVNLNGRGHYHETYEKIDGRWLIKTSRLTRLREDVFNPLFSVRISPQLCKVGAAVARRFG